MKAHALFHVPFEGLGLIEEYLEEKQIKLSSSHLYKGDSLPDFDDFDILIVMGGSMGIYDDEDYSFLKEERSFIKQAISMQKKVVGVCLGAQFIADALGARVYKGPCKEIGWHNVTPGKAAKDKFGWDKKQTVFHWHGDTFDLPKDCEAIGCSDANILQGFVYSSNTAAFQFHLEMTKESVAKIVSNCKDELSDTTAAGKYIQDEKTILSTYKFFDDNKRLLWNVFDGLIQDS